MRRERIFTDFIDHASTAFADALSQTHLQDPAAVVPLYATMGKLRLSASDRVVAAAEGVMSRIIETYYLPSPDFKSPPTGRNPDFDPLRSFAEACRAELRG
jgi:hypothetical protein